MTSTFASRVDLAPVVEEAGGPGRLYFAGLRIDADVREVIVDEHVVELARLEFDLLAHLAGAPRRVFSRGQLLADVWHSSPDWHLEDRHGARTSPPSEDRVRPGAAPLDQDRLGCGVPVRAVGAALAARRHWARRGPGQGD